MLVTKMDQNCIIAISSAFSACATIVLARIALVQLRGLKEQIKRAAEQDRRRNTLEACQRFEKIPIREARKTLWGVTTNGTDYTKLQDENKFAAFELLVYFQGLAI